MRLVWLWGGAMRSRPGFRRVAGTAALLSACWAAAGLRADEVAFDDFEDLTLVPFEEATGVGDGTDWTQDIPGWTIDNSELEPSEAEAYNGWSALDVNSWIEEQGIQAGRDRFKLGVENNTALVADPDAWDDFFLGGGPEYTSFISREYDITGAELDALVLSFDWDFVTEDDQRGVAEVSFDGGATWQTLFDVESENTGGFPDGTVFSTNPLDYTVEPTQGVFVSGTDFTVPSGATSMIVRFSVLDTGNDWWFAVDNVSLSDGADLDEFDDFEGLDLKPFPDGGVGIPPGDGTDWTDIIGEWMVDNTGLLRESSEGAFNGWRAVDVQSWVNEQGGQNRSWLNEEAVFGSRNTILLADPDAHDDYTSGDDPDGPDFNSYVYREYDLTDFDNASLVVTFDWEFRAESSQRGIVEASFDGGDTWVTLLNLDSDDPESLDAVSEFLFQGDDLYATFQAPQSFQFGGAGSDLPALNSNSMILRFGLIDAQNNWWFAIDEVLVEADPQAFVAGDANNDGSFNVGDIGAFITALQDPDGYAAAFPGVNPDEVLDINADGGFNVGDIGVFIRLLQ